MPIEAVAPRFRGNGVITYASHTYRDPEVGELLVRIGANALCGTDRHEYFNGTVKSIGFEMSEGPATVGVMAPGEYEFGTAKAEVMHVVAGALTGDKDTKAKGRADQRRGKFKEKKGNLKDLLK